MLVLKMTQYFLFWLQQINTAILYTSKFSEIHKMFLGLSTFACEWWHLPLICFRPKLEARICQSFFLDTRIFDLFFEVIREIIGKKIYWQKVPPRRPLRFSGWELWQLFEHWMLCAASLLWPVIWYHDMYLSNFFSMFLDQVLNNKT